MEEGGCRVVLTAECQYMVHMWGHTLRIFITNLLNKTDKCTRHEAISNYIYSSVMHMYRLMQKLFPKRNPAGRHMIAVIYYCSCTVHKNDITNIIVIQD